MSTGITGTATATFLSSGYVIEGSNINVRGAVEQATHKNSNNNKYFIICIYK